jgi:hypothetical protein
MENKNRDYEACLKNPSKHSCCLNFWRRNYFFLNFSTHCIQNVNNTGTKYVRIMKQTAF